MKSSSPPASNRKTFKISMIDDEPDSMDEELDEVGAYLNDRGFELETVKHERAVEASELDPATDLAFIDKNLNGVSGIDMVGRIRERHKLLDILVYSRKGMDSEDTRKLNSYGLVEIVQQKEQVIYRLKTLVEKSISKWDDIVYLRGTAVSRLIDLEQEINDVLMKLFSPSGKGKQRLRDLLFESSDMPMRVKQNVLGRAIKPMREKPFAIKDLQALQEHRNALAHCKRSREDPNVLVQADSGVLIDRARIKQIFEQSENFSKCLQEFGRSIV